MKAIRLLGSKDLKVGCLIQSKSDFQTGGKYYEKGTITMIGVWDRPWDDFGGNTGIEILGNEPHLEDMLSLAETDGIYAEMHTDIKEISFYRLGDSKRFIYVKTLPYNPTIPLLDQPNLSDILNFLNNVH